MKKIIILIIVVLTSGCALTHEQVVARAKQKSNAELCMARIQFPQYSNEVEAELEERGYVCDMQLTVTQVREQNAKNARYQASLMAAAAMNSAQPTYQIVPPVQLASANLAQSGQILQTGVTAYFTGQQQQVQTVTNQFGWSCQYNYGGRTFWRTFVGACPQSVQVQ